MVRERWAWDRGRAREPTDLDATHGAKRCRQLSRWRGQGAQALNGRPPGWRPAGFGRKDPKQEGVLPGVPVPNAP